MKITVSPQKTSKFLLIVYSFLLLGNLFSIYLMHEHQYIYDQSAVRVFNFDVEKNLPTIFSTLNLGLSSFLFFLIATYNKVNKNKYFRHWFVLSFVFFFLMVDEITALHEMLIHTFRSFFNTKGVLHFAWMIPYVVLSVLGLVVFSKFLNTLPKKTLYLLLLSALIFFYGAVGMEMIGGNIAYNLNDKHSYDMGYMISYTFEESFEMLGVILLIYTLLTYILKQKLEGLEIKVKSDD